MLASGMQETITNECPIVDFSYEIVILGIEYCYDQDIDRRVTKDNIEDLMRFADKYQIRQLHVTIISFFYIKFPPF